ncbi:MAG: hypothetical protein D3M94_10980 [Rhodocyclales bacterium GT-UBC]|nr:MAG: hypothetical protein D3M94_10980 [Rhodocyclales bacterium GT-UBC]
MQMHFKRTVLAILAALSSGAALAQDHGHHHHGFAPDVDAFHAVLAPIWHAPAGKARADKACASTAEFARLAGAIKSADAKGLQSSIERLQATCRERPAEVDASFAKVHDAFHQLIDVKPGKR